MTRRDFLATLAAGAPLASGADFPPLVAVQPPCRNRGGDGQLVRMLPLSRAGAPDQPFGVKFGGPGLDARLITDLSLLGPERLITPSAEAFIRTECPPAAAAHMGPWTIALSGLAGNEPSPEGGRPGTLQLEDLLRDARPMGAHLFECSGNNNPANFGLMSVAEWEGVPLADLVSRLQPSRGATGVRVRGVDHEGQRSRDSLGGASWIFPLPDLEALGAFLAVRMNGEPLPADHGRPVRLVVPGWYSCTWIKWVDEIRLVGAGEPATGQMKEFAGRTHQAARHELARDYAPADIQTAAMPVRVEQRRGPAGLTCRIVGIVWGGTKPVGRLAIRFGAEDTWKPFAVCPPPETHRTWSLWEYQWNPAPGLYSISLRVPDEVPQRRLETGYYMRQVAIHDL